jgi:hypothetical protein
VKVRTAVAMVTNHLSAKEQAICAGCSVADLHEEDTYLKETMALEQTTHVETKYMSHKDLFHKINEKCYPNAILYFQPQSSFQFLQPTNVKIHGEHNIKFNLSVLLALY